jgi:minor extracellular serine protease Vpr
VTGIHSSSRIGSCSRLVATLVLLLTPGLYAMAGEIMAKAAVATTGIPSTGVSVDNKTDPALRYLAGILDPSRTPDTRGAVTGGLSGLLTERRPFFPLFSGTEGGQPEVQVFVRLADPAAAPLIERLGGRVLGHVGDILTVRIPVRQVQMVAALPEVHSVQISGTARPALDLSRTEAGVDIVHAGGGGLDRAYTGAGVIVGIFDSGVDWSHPDFYAAVNNTRIRFLFDYSSGTDGREWTKAQIDGGFCEAIDGRDGRGHGTHVAGTAAGGGLARSGYIGMAPGADIIAVKGSREINSGGGFGDVDIVNGVQYIFTKAATLNEPAVVNLSLGGHFGAHDGTSLLDQSISGLVGPGKIVVASAGNEGSAYIHAGYPVQAGTGYSDALETMISPDPGSTQIVADLWYPGSPSSVSVGIAAYLPGNYAAPLAVTAVVAPGQVIEGVNLQSGGTTLGFVTIDARTLADPNNGSRRVFFLLEDRGSGNLTGVEWSVYTFGSGTIDMWAVTGGRFTPNGALPAYFRQGDNLKSVGSPATARGVISVASYVSKNSWIDIDDTSRVQPGNPVIGEISTFSSHGPSRDGRILPLIAAPGEAILSALSSSVAIGTDVPRSDVLQGGLLQKMQGTSMASPHVTGAVALMLERNRYLTPENVADILRFSALPVGASPNTTWGAGKMRAAAAMLATPPALDCATLARLYGIDCDGTVPARSKLLPAYPNPFNPATTLAFQTARSGRVELAVYDLLGRMVRILADDVMSAGYHSTLWNGDTDGGTMAGSGVYMVRLRTPESSSVQRIVLLK